jgi:hypothetical protein
MSLCDLALFTPGSGLGSCSCFGTAGCFYSFGRGGARRLFGLEKVLFDGRVGLDAWL